MKYVISPDGRLSFYETLQLLEQLVSNEVLSLDPNNSNNILVYKIGLDKEIFGVSEGWVSENIHSVAQTLQYDEQALGFLLDALLERGVIPTFRRIGGLL